MLNALLTRRMRPSSELSVRAHRHLRRNHVRHPGGARSGASLRCSRLVVRTNCATVQVVPTAFTSTRSACTGSLKIAKEIAGAVWPVSHSDERAHGGAFDICHDGGRSSFGLVRPYSAAARRLLKLPGMRFLSLSSDHSPTREFHSFYIGPLLRWSSTWWRRLEQKAIPRAVGDPAAIRRA